MYDSIGFRLENYEALEMSHILTNPREIINEHGEIFYSGYFHNFHCKINGSGITLYGSLAKYYFGDNLQVLTRKETEQAIQKLSDEFGLNYFESKIFRIDIGQNFIMKDSVNSYFRYFGELSRLEKKNFKYGLTYYNKRKALSFYDKQKEMEKDNKVVPDIFKSKHILRYENQFKKNIKQQFGLKELTAAKLFQENFYIKILNKWRDEYFSIQKTNKLKFNSEVIEMLDCKYLMNQLALIGVQKFGEDSIKDLIEDSYRSGKLKYMQAKRLKDKIKEISNLPELTEKSESILELDSKVNEAIQFYR